MHSDGTLGKMTEEATLKGAYKPEIRSAARHPHPGADGNSGAGRFAGTETTAEELGIHDSVLQGLGLVTPASLDRICTGALKTPWVVEGLIARGSVNIAAGDSGLGKSPLFYQLGLCVAAGIPWLNFATTKGIVVYVDFENAELNSRGLREALVKHLRLGTCPDNFLTHFGEKFDLHRVVREVKPALVIIDSLRSHKPEAEEKNGQAASFLSQLRNLARETDTAFLLVHHTRKPNEQDTSALEDTSAIRWLNQACGARALINQTDLRLALDRNVGALSGGISSVTEEMALVMRGHVRIRGDSGPIHLGRVYDGSTGEERGYQALTAIADDLRPYCSFAYSSLACLRIGMSGSASFQMARKS